MNNLTDQQLLHDYFKDRSETAFSELVRRHVDFVYSAALRLVCDRHLAEDVTQGVFLALAQNAGRLTHHPVLSGWLHCTARNLAANAVRANVRRQAREQEAAVMNEPLATESNDSWDQIAPHLDAALGGLEESDRDALLLRYFERKSAREMGQILGTSEEAAQKRVSRAVERLREFFSKRGVVIAASGLVVLISANAVQSAPLALAATISTAAVLAGTTIQTSTVIATTKAIAMTALQKALVAATVVALVGAGAYEAQQSSRLGAQVQTLQQRQTSLNAQIQRLQRERDDATNQLATLQAENAQLKSNSNESELLKLRGEMTRSKTDAEELARLKAEASNSTDTIAKAWLNRVNQLHQQLEQMPDKKIPELQFLTEKDWFEAANDADPATDDGARKALSELRSIAKGKFAAMMSGALSSYAQHNDGQLPATISQLKPYFQPPVDDAILQRYEMLQTGKVSDARGKYLVNEIAPVDTEYDTRYYISTSGTMGAQVETYSPTNLLNKKYPPVSK